jgi:hypothetical protein
MRLFGGLVGLVLAACSNGGATTEGGVDGSQDGGPPSCAGGTFACNGGGCCACPMPGKVLVEDLAFPNLRTAAVGDLDGDGRADLVLSDGGTVRSYLGVPCGGLARAASIDLDVVMLVAAQVVAGGPVEIVALGPDRTLHALGGADLKTLFSTQVMGSIAAIVPVQMDLDGDHDIAALAGNTSSLLRVENTGSAWTVRTTVQLPNGIARLAAGPLGANARDELLFLGSGLVEVVSVADFDFSDVRPLSNAMHGLAAFGDFDRDGKPDALVSSASSVEIWSGDGATMLTMKPAIAVGGMPIDLAATAKGGDGNAEAVALLAGGSFVVLRGPALAMQTKDTGPSDAFRVFEDDIDGDGKGDVITVGTGGTIGILRAP